MSPNDVIEFYGGSLTRTAKALGIRPVSVFGWKRRGHVPVGRQFQLEVLTRGKLRADRRRSS